MKRYIRHFLVAAVSLLAFGTTTTAQIIEPGVTYVAREYVSKGHTFGLTGPEYHSFEITIYNDGTASGVYKVGLKDYDESDAITAGLTGRWTKSSMYGKEVVKIDFRRRDNKSTLQQSYTFYIDGYKNAYLNDMNASPMRLYSKQALKEASLAEERRERREAEEQAAIEAAEKAARKPIEDAYYSLLCKSRVYYEIVDLGLSVKWASVNFHEAFSHENAFWENNLQADPSFDNALPDAIGSLPNSICESKSDGKNQNSFYFRNNRGLVERLSFKASDSDSAYVAGGTRFGEPRPGIPEIRERWLKKALLLTCREKNILPSNITRQEMEEWALNTVQMAHIPTTAEWQELMDNCTVTGIDANPVRMHSNYKAFAGSRGSDFRMLRITSKRNGKSIVLPFRADGGTLYATSQYLSTDPRVKTCVRVDANGFSFVSANMNDVEAQRYVFGAINRDLISEGINKARADYALLREEYEKQLTQNLLTIGVPYISIEKNEQNNNTFIVVRAPIIIDRMDGRAEMAIYEPEDGSEIWRQTFHKALMKSGGRYVECRVNTRDYSSSNMYAIYFRSDNGVNKNDPDYRFKATPATSFMFNNSTISVH